MQPDNICTTKNLCDVKLSVKIPCCYAMLFTEDWGKASVKQ